MFKLMRGLAGLLLLSGGGCGAPSEGSPENAMRAKTAATTRAGFAECWKRLAASEATESFKGAVAVYRRAKGRTAVLFSRECPPENALTFDPTRVVLVDAIADSDAAQSLGGGGYLVDRRFAEREIGTTSEWPKDIFVVVGQLNGFLENRGGVPVVRRLAVSRKQRLPNEVYGQFLSYKEDRKEVIDFYLDQTFFDKRGYKVLE